MKIEWRPKAERDLDSIVDYIAQDDPRAAVKQVDEVYNQVMALKDFPERGRRGRVQGTFELVILRTSFIAVYRIKGKRVHVLRIMHSSLPWPNSF
ncbi:type II toxin-antitoxin system RelE/ParE family toxin [Desulfuromonas carbonis]